MKLLITGGAGYIGSHMVRLLLKSSHEVVVLDSLENGHKLALPNNVKFYHGSTHDKQLLKKIFQSEKIDSVVHFAAYKSVSESVKDPGRYFYNNVFGTLSLLETMVECNVLQLIFSSTAAVYGNQDVLPITETMAIQPENPYGESKAMVERILSWYDQVYGLKSVALRYFNVAGAWPDGSLGEDPRQATCLIPLVLKAAQTKRPLSIFGNKYPTPDKTAIRDYIHVVDLAKGHIAALNYVIKHSTSQIINLGTGTGTSVAEIIQAAELATGMKIPIKNVAARPGDPVEVWADITKAKKLLGWTPKYSVNDILKDAWAWQRTHPNGFED